MPWRNGRYVPRVSTDTTAAFQKPSRPVITGKMPLLDVDGNNFKDNLFDETLLSRVIAASTFTPTFLLRVISKGTFSAANKMRSLFASGFVNSDLIEDGAVTGAKITNPIKISLISGGSAGNHTVSGITIKDELIAVLEQDGTSGVLTDLSSEFSIVKADTISNTGGTATSSDKLLVFYLSK